MEIRGRKWKKEWLLLLSAMASNRAAWKRFTIIASSANLNSNELFEQEKSLRNRKI